jgi:hypothetical protein
VYFWFFDDRVSEGNRSGVLPGNLLSHPFEYHVKCFEIIKHSELAKKDEWLLFVATKCDVEIFI